MTTPTKAPAQSEAPDISKAPISRKFTVDEYYRMAEAGILRPDERLELICGEIIVMAPMGNPHATGVRRLERVWHNALGNAATVSVQCPIRLNEYADPEPDITVLRYREDDYFGKLPSAEDALLIIEVSDTSLVFDRNVKTDLYAQANVPETWITNLPEDCIEAFTEPGADGYANHTVYRRGDRISPSMLPDVEFAVEDLLPPVAEPDNPDNEDSPTEEDHQA